MVVSRENTLAYAYSSSRPPGDSGARQHQYPSSQQSSDTAVSIDCSLLLSSIGLFSSLRRWRKGRQTLYLISVFSVSFQVETWQKITHLRQVNAHQESEMSNLTNNAPQLQKTLEDNGATISELKADGSIKLDHVTHIISATSDFPQYSLACERMLPVLTPRWITASLLRNKQAPRGVLLQIPDSYFPALQFVVLDYQLVIKMQSSARLLLWVDKNQAT